MKNKITEERVFSIELKSKSDLKNVTLTNGSQNSVLLEGSIGELLQAVFAEDTILEVIGKRGSLRINLVESELKKQPKEGGESNGSD